MRFAIHTGDAVTVLRSLEPESVHCVVTSPPYWGLRDYGVEGQIGLEPTLAGFIAHLVAVFEQVSRVLRKDGTLWVNMGDSYVQSSTCAHTQGPTITGKKARSTPRLPRPDGLKVKDLIGQPWRLAFALQGAGWHLRSDIIWHKPNPMTESVVDRPSRTHEYLFLLSKQPRYHFDAAAFQVPAKPCHRRNVLTPPASAVPGASVHRGIRKAVDLRTTRNRRTVWTIATANHRGAHVAAFPPKLVEPCVLAGCPEGGVVLDPFAGSGTTGDVALQHGRSFVGIELNPTYADMARERCQRASSRGRQLVIGGIA